MEDEKLQQVLTLFDNADTVSVGGNGQDSFDPDFIIEPTAQDALDSVEEGKANVAAPDVAAQEPLDTTIDVSEIEIPEKEVDSFNVKDKVREYSLAARLDYEAEKKLMEEVTDRESLEKIVGKMASRDEFINTNVNKLIEENPLLIPILQNTAEPLEVIQDSVKRRLGDLYTDAQYDNIVEKFYKDGQLTEDGKKHIASIEEQYRNAYKSIVDGANKYADEVYDNKKEYQAKLKEAVKSTKLLGAVVPSEDFQKELLEEVEKGDYFNKINSLLKDDKTKVDTELVLAALANNRLRAMLAKEIYNLGQNSKKNEIIKSKL